MKIVEKTLFIVIIIFLIACSNTKRSMNTMENGLVIEDIIVGEGSDNSVAGGLKFKNLIEFSLAEYVEMGGAVAALDVVRASRQVANLDHPLPPDERLSLIDQCRNLTVRDWLSMGGRFAGVVLSCFAVILVISSIFGAWAGTVLIIAFVFGVVYKAASLLMTL